MKIKLNGQEKIIEKSESIESLADKYSLEKDRIVIEYNGKILKQEEWENTPVEEDAIIEIIRFVGGG